MSKKKILLLAGGGYADLPLILAGKKLGYRVVTSGNRPEDIGHRYSDEYHKADFSNQEAMLSLAKKLNIAAICACCNDFSAMSSSFVAEKLGLPGHDPYETTKIIHHKDLYREFAQRNGIPTPLAKGFSDSKSALEKINSFNFPVIIKPVDLTGGKGISIVSNVEEAKKSLQSAFSISRAKRVVIEEFIDGTRHGFSAFLRNKQVVFFFTDNEHYFLNPYMVSAASTPSIVGSTIENELCSQTKKIASLLNLKSGIFHVQFIVRDNIPVIIEICRRAPGDLYLKLVEYATGVDYANWIVRASAGLDCEELEHKEPHGFLVRHCVMSSKIGMVNNVVFDPSIEHNVIDKMMWWKHGEYISDLLTTKLGIVFLKFGSRDEMLKLTERMQELIKVVTD